jgi:hypothetical protein
MGHEITNAFEKYMDRKIADCIDEDMDRDIDNSSDVSSSEEDGTIHRRGHNKDRETRQSSHDEAFSVKQ